MFLRSIDCKVNPNPAKCIWQSISPGKTVFPSASIIKVSSLIYFFTALSEPTKIIRAPFIATASARRSLFIVTILPFKIAISACINIIT